MKLTVSVALPVLCVLLGSGVTMGGSLRWWFHRWWLLHRQTHTSASLIFEDCGTKYDVIAIHLSSCTSSPCTMKRGTNVTVNAEFTSNGASTDSVLKHEAHFVLNGVKTKATITPTTCDGAVCPLQGALGLLFSADIYVNPELPPINGKLRWELRNKLGDTLLCYQLPVCIA
ncbi:NPC intracellular cholesterol transporter 2 [Anopheles darlingi]|uniref:NPC intracellular cholesterol transporter 2 n=1 Tax=Anopheles darlingi TaxID=43151 RepID=UPI0021002813|nr:NPC intracellular cholesterol transporter 2 [Anopheles darlingi]